MNGLFDRSNPTTSAVQLPNHDLHNHTIFSGHSDEDATIDNLVNRANELQIDILGLSEHVMRADDLAIYHQYLQDAHRHRSRGTLVLVGVEIDIDPADAEARWVVPDITADYVIMSAHGLPRATPAVMEAELELPLPARRRAIVARWLEWYGRAVSRGGMQILGHPLREPISMGLIDLADPETMEKAVDLFRPTASQNIAFELNDAFLRYLDATGLLREYVELIRRLHGIGIRFSRGSDSHAVDELGACEMIATAAAAAGLPDSAWIDARAFLGH